MQWLIDLIKEWVIDQAYATQAWVTGKNYLTHAFVNRGDPAPWDYDKADFTKDGSYHDWDLSGIVPPGAAAVLLRVRLKDDLLNSWVVFRTHGHVNGINAATFRTQVANIVIEGSLPVPLDADAHLDYNFAFVSWIEIKVAICGWWL